MKYELILFDLDGTLLDYEKAQEYALKEGFGDFGVELTKKHHQIYHEINSKLWIDFENKNITADNLRIQRFQKLFQIMELKISVDKFSNNYLNYLSEADFLIENALEILNKLYQKYKLVIITNGFKDVQNARMSKSPLKKFFTEMIISEEFGVPKPNSEIFEFSLKKAKHKDKKTTIIIGDNLGSDIKGGENFGIDTCWFNPERKQNQTEINPTYEIINLLEISSILK